MIKFYLRLKRGKEAILQVSANSMHEALKYFCQKKKLSAKDLLDIFIITE